MDTTVATIMTQEVDTAHEDTSMFQVAQQVSGGGKRHLIAVDDAGVPTSVFSQRDLYLELARCLNGNKRPGGTTLKQMKRKELVTIMADAPLPEAAGLLEQNKIGCLPVVGSDGALVGILSVVDVLRYVANGTDETAEPTAESEPIEADANGSDEAVESTAEEEAIVGE